MELTAWLTSPSARSSSTDCASSRVRSLDLLLEVRVGFLQAARHVVELIGEPFELVAGLDRDALAEVAAADALRHRPQHLDRDHHAAGEKEPGEKGEHQAQRA